MATDDLTADANTLIQFWELPSVVAYKGSSVTAVQRLVIVYVQVTADDAGDYVDLNDVMPGGSVTIICDLGRAGASAQDATYTTWSSDRLTFANNAGSSEINRAVVLAYCA